jgi:hypothetical protein
MSVWLLRKESTRTWFRGNDTVILCNRNAYSWSLLVYGIWHVLKIMS